MMNISENIIYQNWLPTRFTDFVSKKYNMERENKTKNLTVKKTDRRYVKEVFKINLPG